MGCVQSTEVGYEAVAKAAAGDPQQAAECASLGYDQKGEILRQFLLDTNTALIRVSYLREQAKRWRAALLPRRQDLPFQALCSGAELERELEWQGDTRRTKRLVFATSHGWLTAEHPDPTCERLRDLVRALNSLNADDEDLIFFDFLSLYQVNKLHPDYCHGKRLPAGHPALRSKQQQKWFDMAMGGMDKVFASGVTSVIILPQVYKLSGINPRYSKNERKYLQRGWCRVELSVAAYFGRVANPQEAPRLPPRSIDPQEVKQLMRTGEIKFTIPADEEPVLEMYRRYYYAGKKDLLIQEISAGKAESLREGIRSTLHALDPRVQKEMIAALARAGVTSFIDELLEILEDWDSTVRRSVVQALPQLAPAEGEGRARAFDALMKAQQDDSWFVRKAAVQALPELVPAKGTGRGRAVTALLRHLKHEDTSPSVLQAAAEALLRLAPTEGEDRGLALAALRTRLLDGPEHIRRAAAETLPHFAPAEEEERATALTALLACLEQDEHIRKAVVQALPRLAPADHERRARAFAALLTCLDDRDEDVRKAVVQGLPLLAPAKGEGRMQALAALLACLRQERDELIILATIQSALQLTPAEGEGRGIDITALLEDERWEVRRAAVKTLLQLAPAEGEGHMQALEALLALLRREAKEFKVVIDKTSGSHLGLSVRSQDQTILVIQEITRGSAQRWNSANPDRALRVGHRIIEVNGLRGDAQQLIDECNEDKILQMRVLAGSEHVRRTVIEALPRLAPTEGEGHVQVLASLLVRLLQDSDGKAIEATVQALLQLIPVGGRGRSLGFSALLARLEDWRFPVRRAVCEALPQLAPAEGESCARAEKALLTCLETDGNGDVIHAAIQALLQLSPADEESRGLALLALLARLEDATPDIRSAAVRGLQLLLTPTNAERCRQVAAALRLCLQKEGNSHVKRDAEAVLEHLEGACA